MSNQNFCWDSLRQFFSELASGITVGVMLCASYAAFVPSFSPVPALRLYNEKRLLQIGVLILVGGGLLASPLARQRWLSVFWTVPWAARWALTAVFSLGVLSAALAPASYYAFLEVGHYVLLFVMAGVIASAVRFAPRGTQRILLVAVTAGAVLYIVHFAVGYGMALAIADIKFWPDGGTNFANIRFFNHFQTWTLPLLGGMVLSLRDDWCTIRGGLFVVTAIWWALLFGSSGQGTLVAMGIATLGTSLVFRGRSLRWIGVQLGAALTGWVLYYALFEVIAGGAASPFGDQLSGDHSYRRLDHWAVCLDMAWARPWLGAGPMHYAWPPYQFTEPASPHSMPMRLLAEWGILSTGILGTLSVWGGWRWMKNEVDTSRTVREDSDPLSIGLVATVFAGAAHSMVSGLLVAPLSQVMIAVVGGWAWGRYQRDRRKTMASSASAHAILCGLLIASMAVVGSSVRDLSTAEERREAFVEAKGGRYSPRYWQQGYIGLRDSSVVQRAKRTR